MSELCRCQHAREQHADRENPLQVVPLAMTEADEGQAEEVPVDVHGVGACTVPGCGCQQFSAAS
ncbi:MAG TPA: hypothetical protein VEL76_16050 [Gemmataceae bacterium]|nr:hypothetical protein [Gemmataceae bacterium]